MRTIQEIFDVVIKSGDYSGLPFEFMCHSLKECESLSFGEVSRTITEIKIFMKKIEECNSGYCTLVNHFISGSTEDEKGFAQCLQIYQNWDKRFELVEKFRKENGYYEKCN